MDLFSQKTPDQRILTGQLLFLDIGGVGGILNNNIKFK